MIAATEDRPVHRGFVNVEGRQVHYRWTGSGPAALFIHSSPANSSFVVTDMQAQADRYTCFAFDTPGFGLSDPLPGARLEVADLADAIAAAMTALGLQRVPVYGTHTGAAIALELGYRHPERVTGLVLDGVPIFTPAEVDALGEAYFEPLVADPRGGHFSSTWTRFRDQYRWFPWYARNPEAINERDLGPPEAIHRWTEMFFAAAPHYKPAYKAAIRYWQGAVRAAAGLCVPAFFTAMPSDMLHPHLKRLPPLRHDQKIVEIGSDPDGKEKLTRKAFAGFERGADTMSLGSSSLASGDIVRRQIIYAADRPILIRYAGKIDAPPLLLLHDVPGSGRMVEDRLRDLGRTSFVIAPDIPGNGESDGLGDVAELGSYSATLWRLCDELGLSRPQLEGQGFGASLALQMAAERPDRCAALAMDGLFLPTPEERTEMLTRYAPAVTIEADGAHWYRLWLRLRDSLVYWPWYDNGITAVRRVPADFGAARLHDWTVESMKQWPDQHQFLRAVLRHDAAAAFQHLRGRIHPQIGAAISPVAQAHRQRLADLIAQGPRPHSAQAPA